MGKKNKEIRIIKKDFNKDDYTFVSNDNILNNVNIIKNNSQYNTKIINTILLDIGDEIILSYFSHLKCLELTTLL